MSQPRTLVASDLSRSYNRDGNISSNHAAESLHAVCWMVSSGNSQRKTRSVTPRLAKGQLDVICWAVQRCIIPGTVNVD